MILDLSHRHSAPDKVYATFPRTPKGIIFFPKSDAAVAFGYDAVGRADSISAVASLDKYMLCSLAKPKAMDVAFASI